MKNSIMKNIIKDIKYFKENKLDLYIPEGNNLPVIIYFHGGGIENGSKDDKSYIDFCYSLATHGYVVANVNYSLYPNTKFPEYLYECANAVKYVFDNGKTYGYDVKNIYVSGQSAGAYITMMLNLNKEYLTSVGVNPLDVKGWISDAGQMTDHFNVIKYETGQDPWLQRISKFSPIFYVNNDVVSTPILLIVYENDMPCRVEQNLLLEKAIHHYNNTIEISFVKLKGSHCVGSSFKDGDNEYPVVKEILKWIK